jgi:hypothetical protein
MQLISLNQLIKQRDKFTFTFPMDEKFGHLFKSKDHTFIESGNSVLEKIFRT